MAQTTGRSYSKSNRIIKTATTRANPSPIGCVYGRIKKYAMRSEILIKSSRQVVKHSKHLNIKSLAAISRSTSQAGQPSQKDRRRLGREYN